MAGAQVNADVAEDPLDVKQSVARQCWSSARTLSSGRVLTALGVLVGTSWFAFSLHHVWHQPIDHDARGYIWLAQAIVHGRAGSGVPNEYLELLFDIRLAGYPLFLSAFVGAGLSGLQLRIAVALVQFGLYVGSTLLLRVGIRRVGSARMSNRVAFSLLVVPFPYFAAVDLLTETLVIAGAIATFAGVLFALAATSRRGRWMWVIEVAACSGAVMLVRTDSIFVPAVGFVGLTLAFMMRNSDAAHPLTRRHPWLFAGSAAAAVIALATAMFRVPQFVVQALRNGRGSWDTPTNLGGSEFRFGVAHMKWATGIGDISGGYSYRNPFLSPAMELRLRANPLQWYREEPFLAVVYVALKYFALVDQDVPFTYNSVMPTRPSIVLFFINHVVVGLGITGLFLVIWRLGPWGAKSQLLTPAKRAAAVAALAGVAVWLLVHALPHVETRYGIPAVVGLSAFAGLWASRDRIRRYWAPVAVGLATYLIFAWQLSVWVTSLRSGPM